jgi:hypothetical protein
MSMSLNRPPLTLGLVTSVRGRVRNGDVCLRQIEAAFNKELVDSGFLRGAPFSWIHLIIQVGELSGPPTIRKANRRFGDLPVSIAIPMERLRGLSSKETCRVLAEGTSACLKAVGAKYHLAEVELRIDE